MLLLIHDSLEKQTDREFMLKLYEDNKRLMFHIAKKYVHSEEQCEEIVQDSICKLIAKMEVIRKLPQCALLSYVVSTVRNSAITYGLQRKKERDIFVDYEVDSGSGNVFYLGSPELFIEAVESKELVEEMWKRLSHMDRLLLEGKYILGYSDSELAGQLSCKVDSVRMKLTRARRKAIAVISELEG